VSQENVEIVRRLNALFNEGDVKSAFAFVHPDVRFRDLQSAPDVPQTVRGRHAVGRVWTHWASAYDDFGPEALDYVDAGSWVVMDMRWRGRGKSSGLSVETRQADACRIENGRVVEWVIDSGPADRTQSRGAGGVGPADLSSYRRGRGRVGQMPQPRAASPLCARPRSSRRTPARRGRTAPAASRASRPARKCKSSLTNPPAENGAERAHRTRRARRVSRGRQAVADASPDSCVPRGTRPPQGCQRTCRPASAPMRREARCALALAPC
jgi:ketosteroid isomerase-like protein